MPQYIYRAMDAAGQVLPGNMDANNEPDARNDAGVTVVGKPVRLNVLANDTDPDNTIASLTVTIVSSSAGTTATVNPDGTIHFDPGATSGSQSVVYHVTDPGGLSSGNATLTVNVVANTPPTGADVTRTTFEDTAYTLQTADFSFTDPDSGQTFGGISIDTLPTSGSLTLNGVNTASPAARSALSLPGLKAGLLAQVSA